MKQDWFGYFQAIFISVKPHAKSSSTSSRLWLAYNICECWAPWKSWQVSAFHWTFNLTLRFGSVRFGTVLDSALSIMWFPFFCFAGRVYIISWSSEAVQDHDTDRWLADFGQVGIIHLQAGFLSALLPAVAMIEPPPGPCRLVTNSLISLAKIKTSQTAYTCWPKLNRRSQLENRRASEKRSSIDRQTNTYCSVRSIGNCEALRKSGPRSPRVSFWPSWETPAERAWPRVPNWAYNLCPPRYSALFFFSSKSQGWVWL